MIASSFTKFIWSSITVAHDCHCYHLFHTGSGEWIFIHYNQDPVCTFHTIKGFSPFPKFLFYQQCSTVCACQDSFQSSEYTLVGALFDVAVQ